MDYNALYELWCEKAADPAVRAELAAIKDDETEKESRFGAALTFGTAGLRGILGAGTNRMNLYTVAQATQGLADYVKQHFGGGSVAIAYDSRNMSTEFAKECARVLAGNGLTACVYDRLMPTPMLSYAVRKLKARAGIMITASHNPAQYNGYKAYGEDGCQMTEEAAGAVYENIRRTDMFSGVQRLTFGAGLAAGSIKYIDDDLIRRYYERVEEQQLNPGICRKQPLKVVYSPLNGTGNEPVRHVLADIGVREVVVVPEQEKPDGNFPTCSYPNPEMREALHLGLMLSEVENPDIFIATDPDADRVGVAFPDGHGGYANLTGNEIGVLLLDYIIKARRANGTMPARPVAVESIVSTNLAAEIAKKNGVEMRKVLTGFKYIGEQILHLEQTGEEKRFIFGFEESCGYLAGSYVRDKDAVFASMLLCEMTAYYKSQGLTPLGVLADIYRAYGWYVNKVESFAFDGLDGKERMDAVMANICANTPKMIAGARVVQVHDYQARVRRDLLSGKTEPTGLPASSAVEFVLESGATVMVRPSGTEPKMKLYLAARESSREASETVLRLISADMHAALGV